MFKAILLGVLAVVGLVGCSGSGSGEVVEPTAAVLSPVVEPTATAYPTYTPYPTYTMAPTYTAVPTATVVPTVEPTRTPYPTREWQRFEPTAVPVKPTPTPGRVGYTPAPPQADDERGVGKARFLGAYSDYWDCLQESEPLRARERAYWVNLMMTPLDIPGAVVMSREEATEYWGLILSDRLFLLDLAELDWAYYGPAERDTAYNHMAGLDEKYCPRGIPQGRGG